jgi:hypothetical protein
MAAIPSRAQKAPAVFHWGFCAFFKDRWFYRGLLFATTVRRSYRGKATPSGSGPAGIVATTVLLAVSITEMLLRKVVT